MALSLKSVSLRQVNTPHAWTLLGLDLQLRIGLPRVNLWVTETDVPLPWPPQTASMSEAHMEQCLSM